MLPAEFIEAADALTQDPDISDDTLYTHAIQYLDVLAASDSAQLSGPSWAERIQKVIPEIPAFSTLRLFQALYYTADELGLASGKRYVSATICACGDRVTLAAVGDATKPDLVQALDDVSSIWAAFVLWPCEWTPRYVSSVFIDDVLIQSIPMVRTATWSLLPFQT